MLRHKVTEGKTMFRICLRILRHVRLLQFWLHWEVFRQPPFRARYRKFDVFYHRGDLLMSRFATTGAYEPRVMAFVQKNLRDDAVVIDVGANIGLFLFGVLSACPKSIVHAFEPSPIPRQLLRASISANRVERRITLNETALYSHTGEMEFCVHRDTTSALDGLRDTAYEVAGNTETIKVPVSTLDQYIKQHPLARVDLLKLDVEGAELFVLKGGRNLLKDLSPMVLFEVGRINLRPYGLVPRNIFEFLCECGYEVTTLSGHLLDATQFDLAVDVENEFVAVPRAKPIPATREADLELV